MDKLTGENYNTQYDIDYSDGFSFNPIMAHTRREPILQLLNDSKTVATNYYEIEGINDIQGQTDDLNCFGCAFNNDNFVISLENQSVYDGVNETVALVDEHGFYELPLSIVIVWCILYMGITIAAIFGNGLVMWVVCVSKSMRTSTYMYIANLALADFAIAVLAIPFQFQAALLQKWHFPDFMCILCPTVQVTSVNVSVFTLSAIALDRYRAILDPLKPRQSKWTAIRIILGIWIVGIAVAAPSVLDYKVKEVEDTEEEGMKRFCSNDQLEPEYHRTYTIALFVVQYLFPLSIITGAYVRMIAKLWGRTIPGNREESRDAAVLRNKKKIIKMMVLVVFLFAVCWLPLQLYYVVSVLIPEINTYRYIQMIWFCFHWLAMSNSCCNSFIYAIYNDKFQKQYRARLGWCFKCVQRFRRRDEEKGSTYSDASDNADRTRTAFGRNQGNERVDTRNGENDEGHDIMMLEFNQRNNDKNCARACDDQGPRSSENRAANENETHSPNCKANCRNNNTPGDRRVQLGNNGFVGNNLEKESPKSNSVTFSHQLMDMKNDNDSEYKLPSATQTAVVCCNPRVSANSTVVTVTVVANKGMCQL